MPDIPLIPGTLAQNCYPASAQAFYDEMFARGHAVAPDITGILIQDATPDPSDHSKGWIPTAGGVPIYPGYVFVWHTSVGHWVSRNPVAASDASRRIYTGTLASIDTYDGGEAGVAMIASGPMWQVDTAFDGRVPVGVGVIPTSSPAATIANPGDTTDSLGGFGEYKHVLSEAEGAVGNHTHPFGLTNQAGGGNDDDAYFSYTNAAPTVVASFTGFYITGSNGRTVTPFTTADLVTMKAGANAGVVSAAHTNMQPWIGTFFLKRTIRQFYRLG